MNGQTLREGRGWFDRGDRVGLGLFTVLHGVTGCPRRLHTLLTNRGTHDKGFSHDAVVPLVYSLGNFLSRNCINITLTLPDGSFLKAKAN